MGRNTSVSLGDYFENFVDNRVSEGRFKNASEVIRAGLRLLEEEESKIIILKNAINEGIESGIAKDFDSNKHLDLLKEKKKKEMANYFLTNKAVDDLSKIGIKAMKLV